VIPRSESSGLFSAYVMFAQPSTYHWGRRERWLNWNVTQVPSSFRFKLPADGAILAELKVSGAPDMVLELARLDRQVLQAADDPETIQTSLAAGEYNLVVKSYARRSQSGAGIEKLSTPVELVLDRVR
jgi:hypothetical protein